MQIYSYLECPSDKQFSSSTVVTQFSFLLSVFWLLFSVIIEWGSHYIYISHRTNIVDDFVSHSRLSSSSASNQIHNGNAICEGPSTVDKVYVNISTALAFKTDIREYMSREKKKYGDYKQ